MATTSRKLTGGAGGLLSYFEERELPGLEDYYRQRDRDGDRTERDRDDVVFTEVWGKLAERLGLTQLTREQFTGLVNGEWEGERLVGAGYRKVVDRETGEVHIETGVRTTMIDVIYAAPKSVVTYLVHQDDPELRSAVIDAWRASVREGFETMQEFAKVARVPVKTPTEAGRRTVQHGERAGEESRMQGSATKRVPAEYIALPVLQLAARPTEASLERGYVADPHLHMHVPVIAVVAVPDPDHPDEYRTYTPDEVGIKRQAAERDAILMGEFARRLEDLGIELDYHTDRKGRVTWEVAGIPREASLRFSTNHVRAERLAEEFRERHGRPPTDPELGELLRNSRLRKDAAAKQVDERGAWQAWHDDLRSTGIDITAREPKPGKRERESLGERYEELRDRLIAPDGLHREDSIVGRETVRQNIARSAVGLGLTREELRTFERRFVGELIPVRTARDPEFDLFALPHHIEAEVWIGTDIEARAAAKVNAPTYGALQRAMSNARVRLSQEQRAAVRAMASDTGWDNLVGRAGTGKTTVLRTVADALRDSTRRDRPAADRIIVVSTGAQVARSSAESIGADRWYSIDGFATAVEHGLEVTDRTWVFVDEVAMVDTHHMKLLLNAAGPAVIRAIGDDRQLPAIGAAGWYAEQLERHPGAELTHVYRQRNPDDVRDFIDLGAGRVEEAVRSLHARDRIHVLDDHRHRVAAIVDLYVQERTKGRGPRDVAVIVDGSNHVLDEVNRRVQRERLAMEEISPRGLEVRATDEDRRWSLHRGDLVLFRERVIAHDEVVRNGDRGRIVTVDHRHHRITVALDDGRKVTVDVREEAPIQPVVPAYAVNVNVFQGSEVPVGIYAPSRHADRHSAHTAVTRVVEDLHVVIDRETYGPRPIGALTRDWSRVSDKRTAWSQLEEPARARWAKWKRGEDTSGGAPEPERGPVREGPEQEPEVRTTEEVMAAAAAPRAAGRDDASERERRDAERVDELLDDLEVTREAIRDLRDAEAEETAAANEHEAEESLIHDVDVPPHADSRFGDVEAMLQRRRDRTSDPRYRRDVTHAAPEHGQPQPTPEHQWVDVDALRQRRIENPAPRYFPPDRDNAR
jgi:AAA domain/TrwC relaxase